MLRPAPLLHLVVLSLVLAGARGAAAERSPDAGAARAWAPREWALSAGVFDLAKSDRAEAGLEARFEPVRFRLFDREWSLEPALGTLGNEDGGLYGYFSLRFPFDLGERWRVTPFTGGGVYSAGDGKELGGPVEFRSGLEVSLRVSERVRLGLVYSHLSNAVLYDLNPGAEALALVVAVRP